MGKIVVFTSLTLDGVMQAPGRRDEDMRGGFQYGGWATPYADMVAGSMAAGSMATTGAILLGSGELVRTLMEHRLVDRYVLLIHPLVLGVGRRLFAEGSPFSTVRLVDTRTTTTGVLIVTYEPTERGSSPNKRLQPTSMQGREGV
jgi:hypothetical protein